MKAHVASERAGVQPPCCMSQSHAHGIQQPWGVAAQNSPAPQHTQYFHSATAHRRQKG